METSQDLRALIWCAVSSTSQATEDKTSLDTQEAACRSAVDDHGWELVRTIKSIGSREYVDWAEAEAYNANYATLRTLADAAAFDVLVVQFWDRLARTASLMQNVFARLSGRCQIQIYCLETPCEPVPPDQYLWYRDDQRNSVMVSFFGMATGQFESSKRIRWDDSVEARVLRGGHVGTIPFGYRLHFSADGEKSLVVDEEEANIVQWTFAQFIDGRHLRQIAAEVRERAADLAMSRGRKSDNGWRRQFPRSANALKHVLTNTFYVGIAEMQRCHSKKVSNKPRRQRKRGEPVVGRHDIPIITEDTFAAAQDEMARRYKLRRRYEFSRYPLSGLVRCSLCGREMKIHSKGHATHRIYLICKRDGCVRNAVRYDRVEAAVQQTLVTFSAKHVLSRLGPNGSERQRERLEARAEGMRAELAEVGRVQRKWMADYESDKVKAEVFQERWDELAAGMDEIRNRLQETEREIAALPTDEQLAERLTDAERRAAALAADMKTREPRATRTVKSQLSDIGLLVSVGDGTILVSITAPRGRPITLQNFRADAHLSFGV